MAEAKNKKEATELPEAPASANLKVWIDGYGAMITVRGVQTKDIVERLVFLVEYAKSNGWKPSWREEEASVNEEPKWLKNYDNPSKPNQEACGHTDVTFKQSRTEKNPGRWFKSCRECGKFLGWASGDSSGGSGVPSEQYPNF